MEHIFFLNVPRNLRYTSVYVYMVHDNMHVFFARAESERRITWYLVITQHMINYQYICITYFDDILIHHTKYTAKNSSIFLKMARPEDLKKSYTRYKINEQTT